MARTNAEPSDVRQHLHITDVDDTGLDNAQIQYHLDTYATLIVDEELLDKGHSEARLKTIEALLACHSLMFSGIDELRSASQERDSGGFQVTYSGDFDHADLLATPPGQRACTLDTSGRLRELAEGKSDEWWSYTYLGRSGNDST